eukprot:TRINITY_DN8543_c0_g1_i4.p1 TRINITY_DN8543_c0_g1~~TRINITY_DN8543_c0_g1_i4.p1  ORF type:complete len:340 (+),score=39.21 TRINITY_DN8543_c0_g1_i4:96-1115(+)
MAQVPLRDAGVFSREVQRLRDPTSGITRLVITYAADGKLDVADAGSGSIIDLVPRFTSDSIVYVVLAVQPEGEGGYTMPKFIFLSWSGPHVAPMKRARSTPHRLELYDKINALINLSGEIQFTDTAEISDRVLLTKLKATKAEGSSPSKMVSAPSSSGSHALKLVDPADFEKHMRGLVTALPLPGAGDWILLSYVGDALSIVNTGHGGFSEVVNHLHEDQASFVVMKVVLVDAAATSSDDISYRTHKNIFLSWVGPNVKPVPRAKSSQHRVPLYQAIGVYMPMHGEVQAMQKEDVSDAILNKITKGKAISSNEPKAKGVSHSPSSLGGKSGTAKSIDVR